jgi:hypothetical protein
MRRTLRDLWKREWVSEGETMIGKCSASRDRLLATRPALRPRPRQQKGHVIRAIQGWLGHRSITSTAVYTALAPNRFKDFWRD